MEDVSEILAQIQDGDSAAAEQLLPMLYDELRKLAANRLALESPGQTLQPTALVHEAYIRLLRDGESQTWESKGHFFAAAGLAMRRILVDNARKKKSLKRGGDRKKINLDDHEPTIDGSPDLDFLELDQALQKLNSIEPRKASLVNLRYFAGLTLVEAAQALGISNSTADSDWAYAKAWLKIELSADSD